MKRGPAGSRTGAGDPVLAALVQAARHAVESLTGSAMITLPARAGVPARTGRQAMREASLLLRRIGDDLACSPEGQARPAGLSRPARLPVRCCAWPGLGEDREALECGCW
jgi:hypothetical protein